eukprot:Nk52_evm10s1271 gene=Nk52_evmTU10s1271
MDTRHKITYPQDTISSRLFFIGVVLLVNLTGGGWTGVENSNACLGAKVSHNIALQLANQTVLGGEYGSTAQRPQGDFLYLQGTSHITQQKNSKQEIQRWTPFHFNLSLLKVKKICMAAFPLVIFQLLFFYPNAIREIVGLEGSPEPNLTLLPRLERLIFFGYNPYLILRRHRNTLFDIFAGVVYSTHYVLPLVYSLTLLYRGDIEDFYFYLWSLGWVSAICASINTFFPYGTPYYTVRNNNSWLSPVQEHEGNLKSFDKLLGWRYYHTLFQLEPSHWATFPSNHIAGTAVVCLNTGWGSRTLNILHLMAMFFTVTYAGQHFVIDDVIDKALRENLGLAEGNFCNIPESEVSIEVKAKSSIIHHKERLPNQKHVKGRDETIGKWLKEGRIRECESEWKHGLVCIPKLKKGDPGLDSNEQPIRVTMDLRNLKEILEYVQGPIARINHILDRAARAKVISCIDLKGGYPQFRVTKESQKFLSFEWQGKSYVATGAPEGLPQLTAHFQKIMLMILGDLPFVQVYVDDIVVMSETVEEHIEHVNEVLRRLTAENWKVSKNKCEFGYRKLQVLGKIIGDGKIAVDPAKREKILNWDFPERGKDVEQVLGLLSWIRNHIPHYQQLIHPWSGMKKLRRIERTPELEESFKAIKEIIARVPPLYVVPDNARLKLAVDGSGYGLGCVLYYEGDKRYFVDWGAKSLSDHQHHMALLYVLRKKEPTAVVFRWLEHIMQFQFKIIHCPGIMNVLPDLLSRLYPSWVHKKRELKDSAEILLLEAMEDCMSMEEQENCYQEASTQVNMEPKDMFDLYAHKHGERVKPVAEREEYLVQLHLLGHQGTAKLFQRVWEDGFYWKELRSDCKKVVSTCLECQKYEVVATGYHLLNPIEASTPMHMLAYDLAGPMPVVSGGKYLYILVVVDVATWFVWLRPLMSTDSPPKFIKVTGHNLRGCARYFMQVAGYSEEEIQTSIGWLSKNVMVNHYTKDDYMKGRVEGMNRQVKSAASLCKE